MKKIIALLLVFASGAALAGHHRHGWHNHNHHYRPHHHGHHHGHHRWVLPAVIGGAVIYGLSRSGETVLVQPQTQILVGPNQNCSPWRETQQFDGTIVRERTCYGLQ